MFRDPLTERLSGFLDEIGIAVRPADLPEPTFLPGLDIRGGAILVDEDRLAHPGDLLHEAGHLAVLEPQARAAERFEPGEGDEMAALAWSWAALTHLRLDPAVVFHEDGYKGGAGSLVENFSEGRFIGVPLLQYYGLTVEPRLAAEGEPPPFPHMLRWTR